MTTRVLPSITLKALTPAGRETFITENQRSFNYGALEEFGQRDADFEEEGQVISRATIEDSIDQGQAYQILAVGRPVGGLVVQVEEDRGTLDLLFIAPEEHSKGYGQAAWAQVEETYPAVTTWETFTPYFETRNVHFYVNKLGFEILEFYHQQHPNPHDGQKQTGPAPTVSWQDDAHTVEEHEDFLFIKNRAGRQASQPANASKPDETVRVEYSDKEQLHQLINVQKLRAYRYGQEADGSHWLDLV